MKKKTGKEKIYIQKTGQGREEKEKRKSFPIMSRSIVVVVISVGGRLKHYGEVSEIASQLKKQVKKKSGSNYMVDRRK